MDASVVLFTLEREDPSYNQILRENLQEVDEWLEDGLVDEVVVADGTDGREGQRFRGEIREELDSGDALVYYQSAPWLEGLYGGSVPSGKGAAMYSSIPLVDNDIVCFLDSDVKTLDREYVRKLTDPLQDGKKVAKANLLRVHDNGDGTKTMGGRVNRNVAKPLLRMYDEHTDFVSSLDYPLSGEFAAHRDVLEQLEFPARYGLEMITLLQLPNIIDEDELEEVNLGKHEHLSHGTAGVETIQADVARAFEYGLRRFHDQPLDNHYDGNRASLQRGQEEELESITRYEQEICARLAEQNGAEYEPGEVWPVEDVSLSLAYTDASRVTMLGPWNQRDGYEEMQETAKTAATVPEILAHGD